MTQRVRCVTGLIRPSSLPKGKTFEVRTKPDYSKCSIAQLEDVLAHIDRDRFSERADEAALFLEQKRAHLPTSRMMTPVDEKNFRTLERRIGWLLQLTFGLPGTALLVLGSLFDDEPFRPFAFGLGFLLIQVLIALAKRIVSERSSLGTILFSLWGAIVAPAYFLIPMIMVDRAPWLVVFSALTFWSFIALPLVSIYAAPSLLIAATLIRAWRRKSSSGASTDAGRRDSTPFS